MPSDDAARDAILDQLAERAQAAWLSFAFPPAELRAYLADRVPRDVGASRAARYAAADLGLACACLHGLPGAIDAFVADYGPIITRAARHIDPRPEAIDELRQQLLVKLLVADGPDAPPKLALYTGRGPLRVWLEIAARRLALNAGRGGGRTAGLTDSFADKLAASRDLELSLIRQRHAADFHAALAEAVASLSHDERLLLRLHHLEGLTSTELAPILRTSRATAHRRLVVARDTLRERVLEGLRQRVGGDASALDELFALLSSGILGALGVELKQGLEASR